MRCEHDGARAVAPGLLEAVDAASSAREDVVGAATFEGVEGAVTSASNDGGTVRARSDES